MNIPDMISLKNTGSKRLFQLLILVSLTSFLLSCGSDSAEPSTPEQEQAVSNPTFHGQIADILYDNCVSCHQNGGIGKPSFIVDQNGYEQARNNAYLIKDRVTQRIMPPFLAENSGQCNTFEHAKWLSNTEIQTIANWADNGSPEGTPPAIPLSFSPPAGLTNPSSIATLSAPYSPIDDPNNPPADDYRCFVVDSGIAASTGDQLLTAFEMQPGNDALVHHILLFGLPNIETETAAMALDALDTKQGYPCFGGSGITANGSTGVEEPIFLAGWAPGSKLTEYPLNTGVRMVAGRKLVIQIHYNLQNATPPTAAEPNPANEDKTSVKLKYTPVVVGGPIQEAVVYSVLDNQFDIPLDTTGPGAKVVHTEQVPLHPLITSYNVWGLFPHMHNYGQSISVSTSKTDGGAETCLIDVPRWNFEWQQFFFFDQATGPINIKPGEYLNLTCQFNTTGATSNVTWGEGTSDEMCLSFLYVTENF